MIRKKNTGYIERKRGCLMKTNTISALHEVRLMITNVVFPITGIVLFSFYTLNFTESGKEFKNNIRRKIEDKRAEKRINKAIKQQKKSEKRRCQ